MNRVSPGLMLIAFFAILCGLAGVYVWKQSLKKPAVSTTKPAPPQPRVFIVASTDLPAGRVLHSSDFMSVSISPTKLVEKSKEWPTLLINDGRQIVSRRLKTAIKQGYPFEPAAFYPEGTEPDLTEQLAPGMRAISLSIPSNGVPTKATPNTMVDVLFRTSIDLHPELPEITRALVENVRILAIGNNATAGTVGDLGAGSREHTVTLAVTPAQALRLKATEGHGEFSILLRNVDDLISMTQSKDLRLSDIFEIPEPEPEPVPFVAEVYRRGQRQMLTFAPDPNRVSTSSKQAPNRSKKKTAPLRPDPNLNDNTQPDSNTKADPSTPSSPNDSQLDKDSNQIRQTPNVVPSPTRRLQPSTISMSDESDSLGISVIAVEPPNVSSPEETVSWDATEDVQS